jgi:hypothetical protein
MVMLQGPLDTPLPMVRADLVGIWINNTPLPMGGDYVLRTELRLTLDDTGTCELHAECAMEKGGSLGKPTTIVHRGTWTLSEMLLLHLPTRRVPKDELTLVRRQARNGMTRVVLRSHTGGVYWRLAT